MTDSKAYPKHHSQEEQDFSVEAPGEESTTAAEQAAMTGASAEEASRVEASAPDVSAEETPEATHAKAGRNVPAAIAVGVALLAGVLLGLLVYPPVFVLMVIVAAGLGVWEVSQSLAPRGVRVPVTPLALAVISIPVASYFQGAEAMLAALLLCCLVMALFGVFDPRFRPIPRLLAGVSLIIWVPFLGSFVLLILRGSGIPAEVFHVNTPTEGALRVAVILLLVVSNDTFGYVVGSRFGKHPMAPQVSPKKSWEGFIGSLIGASIVGMIAAPALLQEPSWVGLILAIGIVLAATAGDLAESMVKRELRIKDMSSLLPGHGGVMDRLDSVLFAVPVGYLLYAGIRLLMF